MDNHQEEKESLIAQSRAEGANLTDVLRVLLPCPFCGKGTTEFISNGMVWTGMRFSEPVSVSVNHWCEKIEGQPSRRIERIGKDRDSAIAAWNMRAPNAELTSGALNAPKPE